MTAARWRGATLYLYLQRRTSDLEFGHTSADDLVPSPTSVYLAQTIVASGLLGHRILPHSIVLDCTYRTYWAMLFLCIYTHHSSTEE